MLLKNLELKADRGYVEPKSFVRDDGSEVLVDRDWTARKRELWERSNGQCEQIIGRDEDNNEVRCSSEGTEPHHIVPRSSFRDDRLLNLKCLCHYHHKMLDERRIGGRSHDKCEV